MKKERMEIESAPVMKKEIIEIETAPVKKNIWKFLIIILIVLLLLAIFLVLAFTLYNYIITPKNETNLTNITDINTSQNNVPTPLINNTPINLTNTSGNNNNNDNNGNGETCTPSCAGKQCGGDGCGGSCGSCSSGICNSTGNCVQLINCTVDSNCSYLTAVCGTGLCNQTIKQCYVAYNLSTTLCRNNLSECDAVETCSGNSVSCQDDLNKSSGASCTGGNCQSGKCTAVVCGDGTCAAGENCPADIVGCADNVCYEPACTNGCGQTQVSARANDEACILPKYCNGAGSCVKCLTSAECGANESCIGGNCVNEKSCNTDADCSYRGPGFICNQTKKQCEWKPPIGIPKPTFGIEETYHMYDNPSNRNPQLNYTQNSEGGFYTHYIDNTNPACTNTNNNGTVDKPRCAPPSGNLTAGSIIEIHGGTKAKPYVSGGAVILNSQGTKEMPVFVRGFSELEKPIFTKNDIWTVGKYMILENVATDDITINFRYEYPYHEYISIRNCEAYNGRGSKISISQSRNNTHDNWGHDIVVYNNYLHDAADLFGDTDTPSGHVGVAVSSYTKNIWVVDNHIRGIVDSFHAGHGGTNISYIFIGRNELHHDKENAIDVKVISDFIISQNKMYGYRDSSSSNADAIRINDEGDTSNKNIWIIFNEIFDSDIGVSPYTAPSRPYVVGNLIYDTPGFAILDDGNQNKGSVVVDNTFYDVGTCISGAKECSNNIISFSTMPFYLKGNLWNCSNHHNIYNETLVNMPAFCERISYFQYNKEDFVLTKENNATKITVPGANFEALGVEYNDRISVEYMPEVAYNAANCSNGCVAGGSSTRPYCYWQRVGSVSGDTITLKRDIACPRVTTVTGVNITIWYYPSANRNELLMNNGSNWNIGDKLEYNYDGIPRTISSVTKNYISDPKGKIKDRIVFSPSTNEDIQGDKSLCNWRVNSNFIRDFRLNADSTAIDNGNLSEVYALFNTTFYEEFASLNSLGQLDIAYDFYGNKRPQGSGWDIGAYEYTGGIGGSSAPSTIQSQPESLHSEKAAFSFASQIYNFFKGFLTGNTIKEITGYFLKG